MLTATVRVNRSEAEAWLPAGAGPAGAPLLRLASTAARIFIAYYPTSFCCGHGRAIHLFAPALESSVFRP
jgi:hypothetical protein